MTDRRSKTSRANLGDHIPKPIDPRGSVVIAVRVSRGTWERLHARAKASGVSRSDLVRALLDEAVS